MPARHGSKILRLLAAAASLAVAGGLAPAAVGAAAPSYVALAGTTTVPLASSTGTQLVSVPKTVKFGGFCEPEPQVSVAGTADAVVIALIPVGVTSPTPILFGRLPKSQGGKTFSTLCGGGSALPAGKYKMVTLRTAGTATVTLRLPTLGGRLRVATHRANAAATIARLDAVQPYTMTSEVASFASTHPLAGQGFVMVVGWNRLPSGSVLEQGDCEVSGPESSLPIAATGAPGCPLGGGGLSVPTEVGPGDNFWAGGISNVAAGAYSAGYFVLTDQSFVTAGAIALWVPFAV